MNRLGILIDLAHVSVATMKATLKLSKAPVIFSHSSAYTLCAHRRNVPDDVLQLVVSATALPRVVPPAVLGYLTPPGPQLHLPPPEQNQTGSLVMVNFYNDYVSCKKEATLSQVAGRCREQQRAAEQGRASPRTHTCCLPLQITWTTSRGWRELEQWALVETLMVFQGK